MVIEIILTILVLAALGYSGYLVFEMIKKKKEDKKKKFQPCWNKDSCMLDGFAEEGKQCDSAHYTGKLPASVMQGQGCPAAGNVCVDAGCNITGHSIPCPAGESLPSAACLNKLAN